MIKRLSFAIVAAVALVTAVTGCNTVRGAGEDVENAGAAIRDDTPP